MIKLNKTIQLYDCFEKWCKFENIYLYGDPHFSDLESYQLRFPNEYEVMLLNAEQYGHQKEDDTKEFIKELDEMQVKNINKVCGKKDVLIILGDVGNIEYVKKLKAGYKVLILGNHDRGASYYKGINYKVSFALVKDMNNNGHYAVDVDYPKYPHSAFLTRDTMLLNDDIRRYVVEKANLPHTKDYKIILDGINRDSVEEKLKYVTEEIRKIREIKIPLFDEVYEGTLQINPKIMLSHEPVEYKYCLNIHGHNHFGPTCNNKVNVFKEGHFNAIAEAIGYKPISLSVLLQRGLASNIPDVHRETIDRASKK